LVLAASGRARRAKWCSRRRYDTSKAAFEKRVRGRAMWCLP
jgi:hypothetical protein